MSSITNVFKILKPHNICFTKVCLVCNSHKQYIETGVIVKKTLAQNFLIDDTYLSKIVKSAKIVKDDRVLEVGPGLGNLTHYLIIAGAKVLAIEKDENLCNKIINSTHSNLTRKSALKVINADILKVNLQDITYNFVRYGLELPVSSKYSSIWSSTSLNKNQRIKMVANLPYNITKDFLKKILTLGTEISEIYLMVQREVGLKLAVVDPGDKLYRNISVCLRFSSSPTYLFTIPRDAYYPRPNVSSCLLRFRIRQPEEIPMIKGTRLEFCDFLDLCFYSKRKMLKNACAFLYGEHTVTSALKELGLCEKTRAEKLQVNDFVTLFNLLGYRTYKINN
jgi:ribosomal RNA small subunit methyltransferase A